MMMMAQEPREQSCTRARSRASSRINPPPTVTPNNEVNEQNVPSKTGRERRKQPKHKTMAEPSDNYNTPYSEEQNEEFTRRQKANAAGGNKRRKGIIVENNRRELRSRDAKEVKKADLDGSSKGLELVDDYEMIMDDEGEAVYSINPNLFSTPSPSSPAGSLKSGSTSHSGSGGGLVLGGGGANSATRRIFTPEFKQSVLEAFTTDPECIGNQRATARKFGIHRRQVQKWLQQSTDSDGAKDQNSSDDQQEQKDNKSDTAYNDKSSMPSTIDGKIPLLSKASSSTVAGMQSPSWMQNINNSLFQNNNNSNMFVGLNGSILGNSLTSPVSLERNPSRENSKQNSVNGSPTNNGGSGLSSQKMLELVDELCYLYPSEDFSLLRKAMLKNEVSFTKLSPPLRRNSHSNNYSSTSSSSPPCTKSTANDFFTQQTLQMIKNQNEYLHLLQSGYANLPSGLPEGSNFPDMTTKYSSWLPNPFVAAAAAAAGYSVPGMTKNGNGLSESHHPKKNSNDSASTSHTFASPKAPLSNSKSKTVAAVLAASRNNPSPTNGRSNLAFDKPKRPLQKRRPNQRKSRSANDDDFFDPTSILQVVTTKPTDFGNDYHYSGNESHGMDLTTSSVIQSVGNTTLTTSTLRSKAMNKDYGFLNELGLFRTQKSPVNGYSSSMDSSPPSSSTASLEHFVQNVIPNQKAITDSSRVGGSSSSVNDSVSYTTESSDRTRNSVLEAFNFDPELAGDARGVARKFGLNIRVVQKWIRETPTRSVSATETFLSSVINDNNLNLARIKKENCGQEEGNDHDTSSYENVNVARTIVGNISNGPSVNKRKNPKPNQICDFSEDVEGLGPLDMVVPIKKRRVETPTPTSA